MRPVRTLFRTTLASLSLLVPLAPVAAQRVLGPGADALTLPSGAFRITLLGDHGLDRGRWIDGRRDVLGGAFNKDAFGEAEHSALRALNSEVVALGASAPPSSLGATRLNLRQRVATTRFGVEYGVTDWLTVSVDAPFVRTRAEARLRLDGGLASAGLNPMLTGTGVAATNATTISAYQAAVSSLFSRRADCQGNAGAHAECGIILAETADVESLLGLTAGFANALGRVYGGNGYGPGLPFVPMEGSAAEGQLLTRSDSLRAAFTRYGVTNITVSTGLPLGAQAPLTAAELTTMVGAGWANGGGYGARPLTRTAFQQIGDVDVSARVRTYDGLDRDSTAASRLPIRQTIALLYRIGSGYADLEENFIDIGSGSGVSAIGVRSLTDVQVLDRLFATATLGITQAGAHTRTMRVPGDGDEAWLEAFRIDNVRIKPAAVIEVGLAPRYFLSEHMQVGAEWRLRSKGQDEHTLASSGAVLSYGLPFVLSPATLDAESDWTEQRLAWTLSYSTLPSVRRGRASLPIEIAYTHEQVVASARGIVPQRFTDRIQIRYYARFFGR